MKKILNIIVIYFILIMGMDKVYARSIDITFSDSKFNSFDNVTLTLNENENNGYVTIPDFDTFINISSDKYISKVDNETYYFQENDYSYTFTGWKIKSSSEYVPSKTVFQSNDIISYDTLNINNGSLELEAVWGRVIYLQNEYTGRYYTDYWIYDKEETLNRVENGTYTKTGAWNYQYTDSTLTLNKGIDVSNPVASLDYAYYLLSLDPIEDKGNAYLNVLMLTGDLDYIKSASVGSSKPHYFTEYDKYSLELTDNNNTYTVVDDSYDTTKNYVWGDYVRQRNIWGSSDNKAANWIGVTFKSVNNSNYNLYWDGLNYSDTMYGNIRFDSIDFGGQPNTTEKRPRLTNTVGISSETSFNGGQDNYVEFTRRCAYNGNSTYVFRPNAFETVVLNGYNFSSWQTSWSSTINASDYEISWYMGGNARVGHITLGTTSSYDTSTNFTNKKINLTITGGLVTGNIYGASSAKNNNDLNDRVINIIGDPTSSSITTNPEIRGNIYGAGNAATLEGNVYINILGCTNIKKNVYGGGYLFTATLYGNTYVTIKNSHIAGDVYGGGYNGNIDENILGVGGNTNLIIENSNIDGNIFGVGMGGTQSFSSTVNQGASNTLYNWREETYYPPSEFFDRVKTPIYGDYNTDWSWTKPTEGFPFIITDTESELYGYVCTAITKYMTWTAYNPDSITFGRTRTFYYFSIAFVKNDVNINITGSTIGTSSNNKGNIYGGGSVATVYNDVYLNINNSTVYGTIYGGGDGVTMPENIRVYTPLSESEYTYPTYTINADNTVTPHSETLAASQYLGEFAWSNDSSLLNNETPGFDFTNKLVYSPNVEKLGSIEGNITINIDSSTVKDVYGGGNAGIVGVSTTPSLISLTITSSNANNVYTGGNSADVYGSTNLIIDNSIINGNTFGGGNAGNITSDTTVLINDGTINGSVYAGGNTANVLGNTNLTIAGNSVISTAIFGGGNAGAVGSSTTNNSLSTVKIVGGIIGNDTNTSTLNGNVYGGCNTSVVYGKTNVLIGENAVNDTTLNSSPIDIKGTVFGGGEANASGSTIYDFSFISVTNGTNIEIDANNYETFNIRKSIFGSGNASSTSGSSTILIANYGTSNDIKENVSIQRASSVTLKNSYIDLAGTVDSTNRYATEIFSISRIDEFNIQDSYIFLQNGTNLLKKWASLDTNGNKATKDTNNNRVYIYTEKNMKVTTSEDASSFGEVSGITYMGIYTLIDNNRQMGIYSYKEVDEATLSGVYILGAITNNYEEDGFISNFNDNNTIDYVKPLTSGLSYVWRIGSNTSTVDVELKASRYATLGKYLSVPLLASDPATTYTIREVDFSKLTSGVNVLNGTEIKKIADSTDIANNNIGLRISIDTNEGWSTSGTINLDSSIPIGYTGLENFITQYSTTTPNLKIYLDNSANFTRTDSFGTIGLSLTGVKQDEIYFSIYEININITIVPDYSESTFGYEASITSGKNYEPFGTSSTIINQNSSFSVMYSLTESEELFTDLSNLNRVLVSDYILPKNTTITLLDITDRSTPKYYSYISDGTTNIYEFSKFTKIGTTNTYYDNTYNYYNNNYYNEQFILIVDFKNVSASDMASIYNTNHTLLIELYNGDNTIGINNETINSINYIVENGNITFSIDQTDILSSTIRPSENIDLNIVTSMSSTTYTDTILTDKKMSVKISLYKEVDGNYEVLKGSDILDKSLIIDNEIYYANMDGTYIIKLNDSIVDVFKNISIDNSKTPLDSGNYKISISYLNTYSGTSDGEILSTKELYFSVYDESYGLKVTTADGARIYMNETKTDYIGNNQLITFDIAYSSNLSNPNLSVEILKKSIGSNEYISISKDQIFTNDLVEKRENEYAIIDTLNSTNTLTLNYLDNVGVGSYKFVFKIYNNDILIGEYPYQIIVK